MKKSELTERIKELEQREVLLEFIVQKLYELVEVVEDHPAGSFIINSQGYDIARHLYNNAEIRTNIEEHINLELEY